jgi:glucose-6-phosphate-specific signal transduction histidine kinase
LHDELGQSITAVKSLATVIATTTGTQTKEIRNLAYSIIDLSGRLYDVVNNIMQRLRPDIIDSMDFNESINNCIVRSQLEAIGVNCDLNINGDINDLDEVVKITIFRIVQECLTNISKYAMASNVSIHIQRGPEYCNLTSTTGHSTVQRDYNEHLPEKRDAVKIEIIDDGVGMDVNEVVSNDVHAKRHGLQGIHERVTAMGGTLIISGNLGKGVKIQAVLLLDSSYHDISQDINKCITNLKNLRDEKQDSKKIRTH